MTRPTKADRRSGRSDNRTLPPDRVLALARMAFALSVVFFLPSLLEQFETAKSFVIRVAGFALLGALMPRLPVTRRRGLCAMDVAVAAWLAVEIAATVFSVNPRVSLLGDLEQHDGLITSLGLAGIYLGFRLQQTSAEQVARTLVWWLAAAALASVYA